MKQNVNEYIPQRPGSAPPTFPLSSTSLFAFNVSNSSDLFSSFRDQYSNNNEVQKI